MFARTLRLLRPLKIHPGILPATDLNNVAGEGGEAPPTLFPRTTAAIVHAPRGESWKSKTRGENRFLTTIPDRSPLPATPLKSLRAIRKARHRSCEAVLGPSTSPYLLDTRFNSESRFTAPTVYATVFNNASTLAPRFPSPSSPTKNPRKKHPFDLSPIFSSGEKQRPEGRTRNTRKSMISSRSDASSSTLNTRPVVKLSRVQTAPREITEWIDGIGRRK